MPDLVLFDGGEDGYGFAVNPGDGRHVYHWSFNWDCRHPRRTAPSLAPIKVEANQFARPTDMIEWNTETNNEPEIVWFSGNGSGEAIISVLSDGAIGGGTRAVNQYTSAVLYRFDQDATQDVNEPMIFVVNGTANDIMGRRKRDGTNDTGATVTHTVKADVLGVVGGDLWIAGTADTGQSNVSDAATTGYLVAKLTVNADPGLTGSYVVYIPVGLSFYAVNKILPLGGSPIVLKPEGAFKYNPDPNTAIYENLTPFITPHEDNGKNAIVDGRGRIYYDTADGDIIVIQAGFMSQQSPVRTTTIDRDTPFGRITAMTASGEGVWVATEAGQVRTQELGMHVQSDNGGVFTNHTTSVTDGKWSTSADWTLIDGDQSDFIYIGADEPWLGAFMEVLDVRTSKAADQLVFQFGIGAGTWATVTDDCHDSTMSFAQSGLITVMNSGREDLVNLSSNPWVKSTVNSVEKYWFRIRPATSTVLTGVKIKAVFVVPARPPLDPVTFPISQYAIGNCLPHILHGTWRGETITWQDVWTLDAPAINKMMIGRTQYERLTGRRSLYCLGGDGLYMVPVGTDSNPIRTPWPKLADYGESQEAQDTHILAFSGVSQEGGNPFRVTGPVKIDFPFIQADDVVKFVYWWDDDPERYYVQDELHGNPIVIEGLDGQGSILYGAILFSDASRDAVAPQLLKVSIPDGAWEDLGPLGMAKEDIAAPQNR